MRSLCDINLLESNLLEFWKGDGLGHRVKQGMQHVYVPLSIRATLNDYYEMVDSDVQVQLVEAQNIGDDALYEVLKEDMESGWKIVASYWQGYSPDPNGAYRYDDASCKEWSDLCQGSFKISTIRVTAEDTL